MFIFNESVCCQVTIRIGNRSGIVLLSKAAITS